METTAISVNDFVAKYIANGITQIFCTDISKDGKLEGPSIDLYRELIDANKDLQLIASGGVATMDDLYTLKEIGCHGAIIGKAIYENRISLNDLKAFIG